MWVTKRKWGFVGSSAGKESACNAGDPSLIPGSGRSTGEVIGYPLQYSWASSVAQLVKNLPVMWETWIHSLGWEDPMEEGMATHSSILAWRIPPWTEKPGRLQSMGSQKVGHSWATKPSTAQEDETLKKMHSLQKMTSRKLGECYHTKGAGGSMGGKNEFRSQATACPMCEIHSLHFFLNKLLKRKSRSQNFIGQYSGFWKCVSHLGSR